MLKIIKEQPTYTHRLEFDVLMKDLTTRKIELKFNGWDEWEETGCSPLETANLFYRLITKGLDKDKLTLGWKMSIWNLETNGKFTEYDPWIKPGYS